MAFFNVTGTVNMSQGKAIMTLTPEPDIKVTMTRPSTSQLLEKIGAGTVKVHDSRHPVAKRDLTTMMGTIQRQLRLRPGGDGEWSADAQQRLENLLANPKRSTATVQLALEDVKPSSSSSTLEEKKPASSSSTSDSDSDSSSSEGPQHQADAELEKKSKEVIKWKEEFEGIFSALHHTSCKLAKATAQIEEQNEIIAGLSQENAALRRRLQPENAADIPMDMDESLAAEASSPDSSDHEMASD